MDQRKILLVDDDRELIELLRFSLTRAGFRVRSAYDVDHALFLMDEEPDLAVIDINLGTRDGFELRRVRQRLAHAVHASPEKLGRIVECFGLHVLRQGERNRAALGRIQQHAYCGRKTDQDLFRASNAIEIA